MSGNKKDSFSHTEPTREQVCHCDDAYVGLTRGQTHHRDDAYVGLTREQVRIRVEAGSVNRAPKGITPGIARIVSHNVFTLFNIINLVLALLVVLVGHSTNALFFGVAVFNTVIAVVQEIRAKLVLDKLSIIVENPVSVIRDGEKMQISPRDVVIDDIMLLAAGEQVCADALVLASNGLEVDESLLTGESVNVEKPTGKHVLSGSFVTAGNAYTRVKAVGAASYANTIAVEAKGGKKPQTPMMRAIKGIIKALTFVIIPIGALLFLKNWRGDLPGAVLGSAAAMIGMIPEGLVLLTGTALTMGALRLARASALVQTLPGIETLARTDVICLDKTGTMTSGALELVEIIPVAGLGKNEIEAALREMLGALHEDNPVSSALFEALGRSYEWTAAQAVAAQSGAPQSGAQAGAPAVAAQSGTPSVAPFSSERKWSGVSFKEKGSYILGAPRAVAAGDQNVPWDAVESHARNGMRVLCLAHAEAPADGAINLCKLPDGLNCIALLLFSDVLRREAADTIEFFAEEGVTVKVISGDDPLTVSSIAEKAHVIGAAQYIDMSLIAEPAFTADGTAVGEMSAGAAGEAGGSVCEAADGAAREAPENNPQTLPGHNSPALQDYDRYAALATEYTVFGRASPRQKKALVAALKQAGHTVCMIGDGVNDVLAMKEADCSIAMREGSGAARGVSDFVLMSSDFSSMKKIMFEGRRVINNIETVSALYLIRTIYSAILSLLYLFVPGPYPFEPLQVTPINIFTVGIPSFFLTLRNSVGKPKNRFIRNIFKYSLPAALTIAINILLIDISGYITAASPAETASMRIILTGAACFYTLYLVSRPHGKGLLLYFLYIILFNISLIVFTPFFRIENLEFSDTLSLIPPLLCLPLIFHIISRIAVFIQNRLHRNTNRL